MKDETHHCERDPSVTQHNDLIESSSSMTRLEKRLLAVGMSKVNPMDAAALIENHQLKIVVTAEDWARAYPGSKNPCRDIRVAAQGMIERSVTIRPARGVEQTINWFEYVKVNHMLAEVELQFTWTIQDLLQNQLCNFTTYRLAEIGAFNSIYSFRLYELLMQFKTTGLRRITLDDFRFALDCVEKYPTTKLLKLKVVKTAVSEINAMTRLDVECKDMRKGRRIVGFEFWFNPIDPLSKTGEVYEAGKVEGDAHLQESMEFS